MITADPPADAVGGPPTVPERPTFSVVVSTVDRAAALQTLLAALEHQTYAAFEVIVVVGPTRDGTIPLLRTYGDRVRVLRCPTANLSRSRNLGILAACGTIVAFIDDDAVPCATWLAQLAAAFADPSLAAAGGAVYAIHPAQPVCQHRLGVVSNLGEQQSVRTDEDVGIPAGMGRLWTSQAMGTNMAIRRELLLALGGFDTFYAWVYDDADIAVRLAMAGHRLQLSAQAPVYHVPASSRNRVVRTFTGRWWIGVAAATYFAVRNGRAAHQPACDILRRLAHIVHGEWLLSGELRRAGKIGMGVMWQRRGQGIAAGAYGTLAGRFGRRRLLSPALRARAKAPGAPIRPYLRPSSLLTPAVDPIGGARADGPLSAPPLRIALVTPAFPKPDQSSACDAPGHAAATLAGHLFVQGHTVHIVVPDTRDELAFHHGAYVHRINNNPRPESAAHHPLNPRPESAAAALLAALHRLLYNDAVEIVDFLPPDAGPMQPEEVCALVEEYRCCIIERSAMATSQPPASPR